ncbi:MAG: M23 family metallopeptidase [Candidatus Hodarchaeota archaeon]
MSEDKTRNRIVIFFVAAACLLTAFFIMVIDCVISVTGIQGLIKTAEIDKPPSIYKINFRNRPTYHIIPYYLDLDVGDMIQIVKDDRSESHIRVIEVKTESQRYSCPRVRVTLNVGGKEHFAYCGMIDPHKGGIGPIEIDGVKIGVEITKLVFSKISNGKSPYNRYKNFKLIKDVRLAIWEGNKPVLGNAGGTFVVNQPVWTRNKFGNWLHRTSYGLHSAIDIFVTRDGVQEEVVSPVDGIIHRVYNKDGDVDSKTRSKAIHLYSDGIVGPEGERILFRFLHFSKILVSNEDHVKKGQVIGLTGHTGFDAAIGDHLHLEMRLNPSCFGKDLDTNIFASVPVNPYYYLLEWWETRLHK